MKHGSISLLVSSLFLGPSLLIEIALHGHAPMYITYLLGRYIALRPLRSSSRDILKFPRSNTKHSEVSFSVCAPTLCNSLPEHFILPVNLPSLNSDPKTHLFHQNFFLVFQHLLFPNVELFIYACILVAATCLFACFSFESLVVQCFRTLGSNAL